MITFLRNLLFEHFWLKFFSLALAILIWFIFYFAGEKEGSPIPPLSLATEKRVFSNLPVVVMSSAADVRSFKVYPDKVEVTVQGDSKTLDSLQSKDIRVIVDLTGVEEARGLRKRIDVSTPAGVAHVRVAPEEVQVIVPPKS